jgi:RimJ/RimL family protein N-acetyltransferase
MKIQGKLVYMVPFNANHLLDPAYYEWLRDEDVVRYIGRDELLAGISFSEAEAYVKKLWDSKHCTFLAVHENKNNKFIGTAKINLLATPGLKYDIADLGIMLGDKSFWGKKMSIDVLLAISTFAFNSLKVRKLSAGAYSANLPVVKAFQRIGFNIDGQLRRQFPLGDSYCDHILMSCFENELVYK